MAIWSAAACRLNSKPWRVVGSIAPDNDPPHNLSREAIEAAINDFGFQLWRVRKKTADAAKG